MAAALLAAASLAAAACSGAADVDLLIRNVTVIDPVDGNQGARDVAVRGARIAYVDAPGQAKRRTAARVIDGSGRFLIPGLWDMHVHLTWPPAWREPMLRLFTASGITSVRDTGGELGAVVEARQAARAAGFAAPDVYIAGPLLDGAASVYDGSAPGYPPLGIPLATPQQARVAVATLEGARVDFVKAYEMLAPDVFAAVVAAAAERGLRVAAHVPLAVDAADARVDDLQHLRNLELACAKDHARLLAERRRALNDPNDRRPGRERRRELHALQRQAAVAAQDAERCDAVLRRLIDAGTAQTPTLTLIAMFNDAGHVDPAWQRTFDDLPADRREAWLASSAELRERTSRPDFMAWARRTVQRYRELGGTLLAGTDTPLTFLTPGASLHRELRELVAAGLTPREALAAATSNAAAWFGRDAETGRIAPGFAADLVLLRADPLADIGNTEAIDAVIRAGVYLDAATLAGYRGEAKRRHD